MKNILILLLLAFISSCSKHEASQFSIGDMDGTLNGDSQTRLNFRLNNKAIDQAESLSLLKALKQIDLNLIEKNWPELDMKMLNEAFRYLHSEKTTKILGVKGLKKTKSVILEFKTSDSQIFKILTDQILSKLEWKNFNDEKILLKRNQSGNWSIKFSDEMILLNLPKKLLCHRDLCVDVSIENK